MECCCRCRRPKLSDLGFSTADCTVFHRPQWSKCPQIAFAVYRVVLALYVTGFLLGVIVISVQHQGAESFIYLTTYGFIIFAAYNTVAAFNVILDGCIRRHNPSQGSSRFNHQLHWFLFNLTTNINFLVTIVYWGLIYTPGFLPLVYDLNMHTLTSVICLLDLFLTALPVNLLHFIYPFLVGVGYIIFTLVYWAINPNDDPIYPFLDYTNNPGLAAGAVIGSSMVVVIMQGIIWLMYKLRQWIWIRCGYSWMGRDSSGEDCCFLDDQGSGNEEVTTGQV
ncbi:protein rolling stone-like [Asterias rubens]|uniref:protein rolling stone-like n=1 Tax=Asterias rubens TaxID=7604 RepID=UPI0014555D2C|nr:protein rolling stone-like [Asterias rubens]